MRKEGEGRRGAPPPGPGESVPGVHQGGSSRDPGSEGRGGGRGRARGTPRGGVSGGAGDDRRLGVVAICGAAGAFAALPLPRHRQRDAPERILYYRKPVWARIRYAQEAIKSCF